MWDLAHEAGMCRPASERTQRLGRWTLLVEGPETVSDPGQTLFLSGFSLKSLQQHSLFPFLNLHELPQ